MVDKLIQFQCPCCNKKLQLDTASGQVKAAKFEAKTDGAQMDRLLDAQNRQNQQRGDAFDRARNAESKRASEFDDMFSNAVEDAKEHEDEKPKRPFDLD